MNIQRTMGLAVSAFAATFILGGTLSIGSAEAAAKRCYRVVDAQVLNVRAKARKSSSVLTTIKRGTIVRKAGLPRCGLWWCKIDTGKQVGFAGSKFLERTKCS